MNYIEISQEAYDELKKNRTVRIMYGGLLLEVALHEGEKTHFWCGDQKCVVVGKAEDGNANFLVFTNANHL